MKKRLGVWGIIAALLILSVLPAMAAEKKTVSRAIAIVFDNSGSMYFDPPADMTAWCRALYATEVFADMSNPGDTVAVYPMNDCEIGGRSYDMNHPITLEGGADAKFIRDFYSTAQNTGTPIASITAAHNGLQSMPGDEKYLVVLTDGTYFHAEDGRELRKLVDGRYDYSETVERLTSMLSDYNRTEHVLYMGIGKDAAEPVINGGGRYQSMVVKAADSANVLRRLTEMSNMIYGRDALPTLSGNSMNFDIAMSRLILFVQGSGITDVRLLDASGREVPGRTSEYAPRYGERGSAQVHGSGRQWQVDTNLSGMIVTYENVPAGTYQYSCGGTVTNAGAYYEPDVYLTAQLVDDAGTVVSDLGQVMPGEYHLQYGLVDRSGQMTESSLLGNRSFDIRYTVNGQEMTAHADRNGTVDIELNEGDSLKAEIDATYLSGYTEHKDMADEWGPGGLQIASLPVGSLELRLENAPGTVTLLDLEDLELKADLYYEGSPVKDFSNVTWDISLSGSGGPAVDDDGEGTITFSHPGKMSDTRPGSYTLTVSASYVNEYGKTSTAGPAQTSFELLDISQDFQIRMEIPQRRYVISKLADGEPVTVRVYKEGYALTGADLEAVDLDVETDLGYDLDLNAAGDAYEIRFDGTGDTGAGRHDIRATARSTDDVGREIAAAAEGRVTLRRLPAWVVPAAIALGLLLLAGLFWLYMNMKVLPDSITVPEEDVTYMIGRAKVGGKPTVVYDGKGKSEGTLTVTAPEYSLQPLAGGKFSLPLTAVDPRRVASSRRRVSVSSPCSCITDPPTVNSGEIGPAEMRYDRKTLQLVRTDIEPTPEAPDPDAVLGNGSTLKATGSCQGARGQVKVSFSVAVRFE